MFPPPSHMEGKGDYCGLKWRFELAYPLVIPGYIMIPNQYCDINMCLFQVSQHNSCVLFLGSEGHNYVTTIQ